LRAQAVAVQQLVAAGALEHVTGDDIDHLTTAQES
jgi:hypothetical protein